MPRLSSPLSEEGSSLGLTLDFSERGGDQVAVARNVTLTVDHQAARLVSARGPHVSGVVKLVDAANNTITVDGATYAVYTDNSGPNGRGRIAFLKVPVP